jgi:hypothetical protein
VKEFAKPEPQTIGFVEIGRHWLRGLSDESNTKTFTVPVYLNWRTGEFRKPDSRDTSARDLDRAELPRLPMSIQRQALMHGTSGPFTLVSGRFNTRTNGRPLMLTRRGGGERRLSRCARGLCNQAFLAGGLATWSQLEHAYAYDLSRRQLYQWRTDTVGKGRRSDDLGVMHTRTSVIIAAATGTTRAGARKYTVYEARIPL